MFFLFIDYQWNSAETFLHIIFDFLQPIRIILDNFVIF